MTTPIGARTGGMRVVDWLAAELRRRDVEFVFGVDGANIEDLYDAAHYTPGLTAIVAKHEFSAGTMADGYARATSRMSVVVTTSGGGAVNLVPALAESYASGVPVLAIVGQPPRPLEGNGAFQDGSGRAGSMDLQALFRPISGYCARVSRPEDMAGMLALALAAIRDGLPAVLLLPKDVQQSAMVTAAPAHPAVTHPAAGQVQVGDFAERLTSLSGRVLIVAGPEVARHDAREELAELAARLDAFVAVTPDAKDVMDADNSRLLGVVGVMGHPAVERFLRRGAPCLCVGTRMPVMARGVFDFATASVLSIGAEAPYIPSRHLQTTDLARTLADLTAALPPHVGSVVDDETFYAPAHLEPPRHRGEGIRYRDAMQILDRTIPAGADIFVDAGNTGASAVHYLAARPGGRYVVALGMGGMGYAFGAGIGCAFARAGRTIVIAGDGAFFMHGMEIHTAIEHRLPVTFVIVNNNAHAMCVTREQLYYGGQYSFNRFAPSHIAAGLAAMFPALSCRAADNAADLEVAMHASVAGGPAVVEILCATDEIPPFSPFLTSAPPKEKSHDRHRYETRNGHESLARP